MQVNQGRFMDQFTAMRIFRQVVEQGGFSAAAEALDISHTVVSRQSGNWKSRSAPSC